MLFVPETMSWKTLVPAWAYRNGLAKPSCLPAASSASAVRAAMSGAAALVPPTGAQTMPWPAPQWAQ